MCGIVAFCGNKPGNPMYISLLLMYNQSRGEDATGYAINNIIKKDTEKVSKFLQENPIVISESDVNYTVIAHARKGSSGYAKSKELAHPFGIFKSGADQDNYDLILAMNGTVHNKEELAEEFEVEGGKDYSNSDTKIIAKCMTKLGEKQFIKVIEGYSGSATLVFFTPKHRNHLMVYRDPEKTLFYWKPSDNEMYISSEAEFFLSIPGCKKEDVKEFENEHLYTIKDGKITKDLKVTRNPIKVRIKTYHAQDYDYEGMGRDYNSGAWAGRSALRETSKNRHRLPPASSYTADKIVDINKVGEEQDKIFTRKQRGNKVYVILDKYYRNGHPIDGIFEIDDKGVVYNSPSKAKREEGLEKIYCVYGYRCKNQESFVELMLKVAKSAKDQSVDLGKWKKIGVSAYAEYFMYPILTQTEDDYSRWVLNDEWKKKMREAGGTITLDIFLCTHTYKLFYEGEQVTTTQKLICTTKDYKRKDSRAMSLSDIIYEDHTAHELSIEITRMIETNQNIESLFLYNKFNLFIKQSQTDQTRIFFYELLIDILNQQGIINDSNKDDFKKDPRYISIDIRNEIDAAIKIYKGKLMDQSNEGLVDDSPTPAELIASILPNNTVYNTKGFLNDIYGANSEDLSDLFISWGTPGEDREFYEAVLLALSNTEQSDDAELIKWLAESPAYIRGKAMEAYNKWYIDNKHKNTSSVVVTAQSEIGNQIPGPYDEDDVEEQADVENPTVEEWEADTALEFSEHGVAIYGFINRINMYEEGEKTEKIKKMENALTQCRDILEKTYKELE